MGVCQNIPKSRLKIKEKSLNNNNQLDKHNNDSVNLPKNNFLLTDITEKPQESILDSKITFNSLHSINKIETSPTNISSNSTCVQTNPLNKHHNFTIDAIIGEQEIPIQVERNEKIIIKINQNLGNNQINNKNDIIPFNRWSFFKDEKPVNYLGYNNRKYKNINIGALCLRISGDKRVYCFNKLENYIITNNKGTLLFFANLNPEYNTIYEPKGSISISIIGGSYSYDNELYYSYNINSFANNNKINYETKEYKILEYINKARNNLNKFYHDYYSFNDIINKEFKEFIHKNINIKRKELRMNKELNVLAEKHCKDLCDNETAGDTSTDGKDLKKRFNEFYKCFFLGESIIYNINNPLLIVKSLIQDNYSKKKKNRENIFLNKFNEVGICIKKHPIYNFCCVIVFSE